MEYNNTGQAENQAPDSCEKELKHISRGASAIFIGKILGAGISYVYTIVIIKILGVESFGSFMLALAVINFAGVIGRLGLEMGAVRYVSLYNGEGDKPGVKGTIMSSLRLSFVMSIIIGFLLFILEPTILHIFNMPELGWLLKSLAISLPFLSIMVIALSATQGFKIMKYSVYGMNLFWPASNLILVTLFYFIGLTLSGVVIAQVTSVILTSILSIYFIYKTFPEIRNTKVTQTTRTLLRFSLPLLTTSTMVFLIMWTDTLMIGYFRSPNEVGIYNAAMKTALIISSILLSFKTILSPIISDLYNQGKTQQMGLLFKTVTKWQFSICFPLFLLLALLSKEIMSIFGQDFITGRYVLIILAFGHLVSACVGPVGQILTMSGRQDIMMVNNIVLCFLNILLNYVLIPSYGIAGAAIASGLSIAVFEITMLLEVYVLLKMLPHNANIFKPVISGLMSFIALFILNYALIDLNNTQKLLIYTPLFSTLFVLILYSMGIDDEDRFIIAFIKNKFMTTIKHA